MNRLIPALGTLSFLLTMLLSPASRADDKKKLALPPVKNPVVVVTTSMGTFKIELFADKAPISVKNFLAYVDAKFYDGTIFHRVIPAFVIQGGGLDEKMDRKGTREPIANEAGNGLKNLKGTLSMARTSDPDSATSQFFVNVKDNASLDRNADSAGYAVFGKVTDGMDVVMKIKDVPTTSRNGMQDVPVTPVKLISAERAK